MPSRAERRRHVRTTREQVKQPPLSMTVFIVDGETIFDPMELFCRDCGEYHGELAEDDTIVRFECICDRLLFVRRSDLKSGMVRGCGMCGFIAGPGHQF